MPAEHWRSVHIQRLPILSDGVNAGVGMFQSGFVIDINGLKWGGFEMRFSSSGKHNLTIANYPAGVNSKEKGQLEAGPGWC
jgi:hypothetical protein